MTKNYLLIDVEKDEIPDEVANVYFEYPESFKVLNNGAYLGGYTLVNFKRKKYVVCCDETTKAWIQHFAPAFNFDFAYSPHVTAD